MGRFFGEGDQRTVLFFEQYAPDSELRWIVAGAPLARLKNNADVAWRYGSEGAWHEMTARGMTLGEYGTALSSDGEIAIERNDRPEPEFDQASDMLGLPVLDPESVAGASSLEIKSRRTGSIVLQTGDLPPAFEAMNACMRDLVSFWGLDPDRQAARAKGPELTNLPLITKMLQEDYPSRALREGEQADLQLRAMIDADGGVTECVLTNMTTAENFGQEPCRKISTRAIFEPALDRDGQPMPSYYTTRIRYTIRSGPAYAWPN